MQRFVAFLLLALVPAATAFPIGDQPYAETVPFADGFGSTGLPYLSGAMQATAGSDGPFLAFGATDATITGLSKVCWQSPLPGCEESTSRSLSLRLAPDSSFGLQFPRPVAAALASEHSIAFFADAGGSFHASGQEIRLDQAMAAVHVGGQVRLEGLPVLPATLMHDMGSGNAAGLATLDAQSSVELADGTRRLRTFPGSVGLTFQGQPAMAPFAAVATVTPFEAGASAAFEPADVEAAAAGVDLVRIDQVLRRVQASLEQEATGAPGLQELEDLQPLLARILGGALVTLPAGAEGLDVDGITLVRFDRLEARATSGAVELSGSGPLQIQGGRVVGAPGLLGIVPWWCWLLWAAAVGLWVARRRVPQPEPEPAKPAKVRPAWVAWALFAATAVVVFWLWDGQVHKVWGLSLLQGGASGTGLLFLAVMEVAVGAAIVLAVVVPLASLLKSAARFGRKDPRGLHRPVALVLGFLVGTTLLLSYIDVLIGFV